MISHSRLVANRVKRRSITRANRRISLSPGKKNSIVVAVRVRPQNAREQDLSVSKVLQVVDRNILVFDPLEEEEDKFFFQGVKQCGRDFLKKPHKNLPFTFDHVFDGSATNEDVFNSTTKLIIDGVMKGINSSVFAYGATGSGKTFTMIGTSENPGIIFLMVMALFEKIEQLQDKVCDVSISYLEVYNETIKDLLTPSPPLALREDTRGLVVSGLSHFKPNNAEHLMQLLHFGNKNRTQHPTDANSESSRSHAVFQVYIRQKDKTSGLSTNVRMAKLSLIDLAGSERATVVSNREKARLREGASINQSLLALGSCINALADRKTKTQHVPYRNSKLTRILKDSLGGNCFTVMIAAVSPSSVAYEDTYSTLKYADRAKGIQLNLRRNVVNIDAHITKYVKIVESHQNEIMELKAKLKHYEDLHKAGSRNPSANKACSVGTTMSPRLAVTENDDSDASLAALVPLHEEHRRLRDKYLEFESALRLLKTKKNWKQDIQRMHNILSGEHRAASAMDTLTKTMDLKETRLLHEKSELNNLLNCNKNCLDQAKGQIGSGAIDKLKHQELLLQHGDIVKQLQHFLEVASLKAKHEETTRSVLDSLATIVRRQQYILDGRGVLTPDLIADLDAVIAQLHGVKEVNWADQASPKKLHPDIVELYGLLSPYTGNKPVTSTPVSTPQESKQVMKTLHCLSSEKRGYPATGLCHSSSTVDPVRRSLDDTFSVVAVNSPPLQFTVSTLNRTFSPVEVPTVVIKSSTPERPALSSANRTFTPVYERRPVLAPMQEGNSSAIPSPMCLNFPSQSLVNPGAVATTSEGQTKQVLSQFQGFQSTFSKTLNDKGNNTSDSTQVLKRTQDVTVGQHKAFKPLSSLKVSTTQSTGSQQPGITKTPKSWARPFSFKFKAKENRVPQALSRQTSYLPRPGSLLNKPAPSLHRASSTPMLNNFKSEKM